MKTPSVSQEKSVLHPASTRNTADHKATPEGFAVQPNNLRQRTLAQPQHLAPPDVMALQRSVGNHAVQRLLHRKGENAAAERVADQAAARVAGGGLVQRSSAPSGDNPLVTPDIERSIDSARGQGSPMPKRLQKRMEGEFGADFGGVRLHTDKQANKLSRSLEARAFTTGSDIFFKEGEYNPTGSGGQQLIAHELTHVVQQGGGQSGGVQRAPTIQRVTDEYLQTGLGKVKYGKVVKAGKLPYFLTLSKKAVETYKLMPHTTFDEELNKVQNPGGRKKKGKGGSTPQTPELKPETPTTETTKTVESTPPESEPEAPKVDPEVERQQVRELVASNFEKDLTELLARFDTLNIENEDDVKNLLDDVVLKALMALLQESMLRRSTNMMKVIEKLHALHVTAWTLGKKPIYKRITLILTDMASYIPGIKDFAEEKGLSEKVTESKDLVKTRKAFIGEQRDAAKDVSNPSLKVSKTLTISGYKVLQWYQEATRSELSQFYNPNSNEAKWNSRDGSMENLAMRPGNFLSVWAQMKWKDQDIKTRYPREYGRKNKKGQYSLLGNIQTGGTDFNVEDKLWVKKGMGKATRYNVMGEHLDKNKTAPQRAKNIREVVSGDYTNATELEIEAAMAMLGAETARNPRSYGIGLMLLDMIEEGGTYGKNKKKYSFGKLLGSSPHDKETESGFENRKTKVTTAKQDRWKNMKGSIDTESPQFSSFPFKSLWGGKWGMSPSGSMTLGTSVIPSNTSKLNTVQYKELKTILNWYINFMKGAELNVKDESEAKTALVKLFKERLGKTGKMGAGSFKETLDKTA